MLPSNMIRPVNIGLSAFMFFLFAIVLLFLGVNTYLGGCFPLAIYGCNAVIGLLNEKSNRPSVGDCSFRDV